MMNYDDEDDDFAPNPFRSGDLLSSQQHSQQPQYSHQQPDPNSGMTGSFSMPPSASAPPQAVPVPPSQPFLSGPMDQKSSYASTDEIDSTSPGWLRRFTSCFRIEGYQPYFNLDTIDVRARLHAALFDFWRPDHFRTSVVGETPDDSRKGPDLYGPLWITSTLIFVIAVTSNLASLMHHRHKAKQSETDVEVFEYDINRLFRASTCLGLYTLGLPTAFWLSCTCLGITGISWALWVCVYGYSLTPYLIACWLAWIPLSLWIWLDLALATGASVLLVLRNLSTPLLLADQAKAAPIIMCILGAHFVFLVALRLAFYSG